MSVAGSLAGIDEALKQYVLGMEGDVAAIEEC